MRGDTPSGDNRTPPSGFCDHLYLLVTTHEVLVPGSCGLPGLLGADTRVRYGRYGGSIMKAVCLLLALLVAAVGAQASATSGSLGFATPLLSEANASPTGDINTSTRFLLENLSTTDNASGLFAGLPLQSFGTVSFDTTVATSLHISDGEFGSFTSSKIETVTNIAGFLNLLLLGKWTPGTFQGGLSGSFPADFRISFTQSQPAVGEISFSGTMFTSIPPVPEPPSGLLFLTGAGLVLAGSRLRRLLGI